MLGGSIMRAACFFALVALLSCCAYAQDDISSRTVLIHLDPPKKQPTFLKPVEKPRAVDPPIHAVVPQTPVQTVAAPPAPPAAQQPIIAQTLAPGQQFVPREIVTPPPPPPVNIPPDVQNQLIKFFGLDTFGIPGLTGNHPNGFAGAVQELKAAGVPIQGLPAEHLPNAGGLPQPQFQPQNDVLAQANPNFNSDFNQLVNEAKNGAFRPAGSVPLPDARPGENGLIGLLSSSIRKLVQESGVGDALQNSIPNMLGGADVLSGSSGSSSAASSAASSSASSSGSSSGSGSSSFLSGGSVPTSASSDGEVATALSSGSSGQSASGFPASFSPSTGGSEIRRQQSAAQRALSGIASALGGGGNSPAHAGLPRIPGIPLLPGGIPRNAQGQIDVVNLIGSITRRISNGTTLADVLPPEQLQTLADNVTDALLPSTPDHFDLSKFMGRWFEGINSPGATEQRCVVHHYGGLTKNDKTATFTALKIYREGSEFGNVKYSIGYAFRGGNKDAMLQLHSSETNDAQPFWIYKLGPEGTDPFGHPQYEYAIVSNWVKYPVTVLVRDPDTFKAKHEHEVMRWLEDQGFINGFVRAFNMLQPAGYSQCKYADSTFEVFGRK
uniref:Lipocln_cytosolic_FA-bd_dom domain-containing protein n=1 Tax=Steinernema glaseri TaxID=37863 RepID=A0A1I7ZAV8_9BILA